MSPAAPGTPRRLVVADQRWADLPIDTSALPTPHPARLVNLSVRAAAGSAVDPLAVGANIAGDGTMPMLVRAIGPGLARFGVAEALRSAPELSIFDGNRLVAQTNAVTDSAVSAATYVGAFPAVTSADSSVTCDAALLGRPAAGTLTAHCTSENGGLVLLEFYDANPASNASAPHLTNVSARGSVRSGAGLMVIGFIIAGEGQTTVLLRGVGATLREHGVSAPLADPRIELFADGRLIAANDNWQSGGAPAEQLRTAAQSAGAFPLTSDSDAALIATLPAGVYTLHVRSAGTDSSVTGTALAEIYELETPASFDAASSTNLVGLDLYRRLAARPGNLIISPYSIESALALAYVGSAGDTRAEMARVLRLPADNAAIQAGFAGLRDALTSLAKDSIAAAETKSRFGAHFDPIQWSAANRVFGQAGYPFRDTFLTTLRDGFAAPLQVVDFRNATEAARLAINTWVADQTHDKILDLIPSNGVTEDTRFALVNALYLRAAWDTPFEAALTAPHPFFVAPGTSREVATMRRTGEMGYASESGLTVVTVDYVGRGLQFVILLPDENETVDALAARLTSGDFTRWASAAGTMRRNVALSLPKFTVSGTTLRVGEALRSLGMNSAFDVPLGAANFDAMAPRNAPDYLALTEVFHKTFVAVDEQGTEAAAATAVTGGVTSLPPTPLEIRVDRPFLFAIQHRATGLCLFLGRISDPR